MKDVTIVSIEREIRVHDVQSCKSTIGPVLVYAESNLTSHNWQALIIYRPPDTVARINTKHRALQTISSPSQGSGTRLFGIMHMYSVSPNRVLIGSSRFRAHTFSGSFLRLVTFRHPFGTKHELY